MHPPGNQRRQRGTRPEECAPIGCLSNRPRTNRKRLSLLVSVACCLANAPALAAAEDRSAELLVSVTDDAGAAIDNFDAKALLWQGGEWQSIGANATSNQTGSIALDELPVQRTLALVVSADGYATSMQELQLTPREKRTVQFKLARPAKGTLQVRTPAGEPIKNVEVQRIDYIDSNQSRVVLKKGTVAALDLNLPRSDDEGKIELPPIPDNALMSIWLIHPQWKIAKLTDVRASNALLSSVTLHPGIKVQIQLQAPRTHLQQLENSLAEVLLFPASGGSSSVEAVWHEFPVRDGRVEFTCYPTEYRELRFRLKDYFATPQHVSFPSNPNPLLDMVHQTDGATIPLLARPKVTVRGRLIDESGNPVSGLFVSGGIENRYPTLEAGRTPVDREWCGGGSGETDEHGIYEIELAPGKSGVEVLDSGFYGTPSWIELEVADDGSTQIPDIVMRPVPVLRGTVVGPDGQPQKDAIVRMRSLGYGDADPTDQSDASGAFELGMSRIPYARDGMGLQTDVAVVAFDPFSNLAGSANVNLLDTRSLDAIQVTLEPTEPHWVLDPLNDERRIEELHKSVDPKTEKTFAKGLPGNQVPDLSNGTWLNSSARSLADFRGKYVLLDFWFIGCGPCHRDMPSVKLAHRMFNQQGFSVVSIHTNSQAPENVQKFADNNGMEYPIVVDNASGDIVKSFNELGVRGFPSYLLLSPEGTILYNDGVLNPELPRLRTDKVEAIYHAIRSQIK